MMGSRIAGLGMKVPDRVVTNDDLATLLDTSDEWIFQRTGIRERRWVEGDVGATDLAVPAVQAALEMAGLTAADLDLIIFATLSPDIFFPGSSCLLQARLAAPRAATLDIRNQCTGFVYGLAIADQFIRTGFMTRILVVGAEIHSSGIEHAPRGREVSVLFGDGAGAAVIVATEGESRILDHRLHADGNFAHALMIEAPASHFSERITHEMLDAGRHFPYMEGRTVFRQAVERLPPVIEDILRANDFGIDDLDVLVPHQANLRINEMVARRLGLPSEKMVSNIHRYGNTTAASIPIALCEAVADGRIETGDLVVTAAFGAGLTWGANLIRW